MKYVDFIRKELGIRTVFNILGPLTNPGSPKMQLLGVYDGYLVEPLAQVLISLGVRRGEENTQIARHILSGVPGPKWDAALLNAGASLYIGGTLLQNGATKIPWEIFSHIRRLEQKGILFCPASGRQYTSLRHLFAPVADKVPFLCENGAVLYGPGNPGPILSKTVMDRRLSGELCRDIMALSEVEVLVSGADTCYICPKALGLEELLRISRPPWPERNGWISPWRTKARASASSAGPWTSAWRMS